MRQRHRVDGGVDATAGVVAGLGGLEASVDALVTAVQAPDGRVGRLGPDEVVVLLQRLEGCRSRLQAVDTALIGRAEQVGVPDRLATRTLPGTIAAVCRVSRSEAAARVRLAHATGPRVTMTGDSLPANREILARAVSAGAVTARQAQVVVECIGRLEGLPQVSLTKVEWAERELCMLARSLTPEELDRVATKIRDVFDPDGAVPIEVQRARRYLSLTCRGEEFRLSGTLTVTAGARLQACLDALAAPRPQDAGGRDLRSPGQRRHDALDTIAGYVLNHLPTEPSGADGTDKDQSCDDQSAGDQSDGDHHCDDKARNVEAVDGPAIDGFAPIGASGHTIPIPGTLIGEGLPGDGPIEDWPSRGGLVGDGLLGEGLPGNGPIEEGPIGEGAARASRSARRRWRCRVGRPRR